MSELVLKINGLAYSGFESVHIHRSMLEISGAFAVIIDNFFHSDNVTPIKMGSGVTVEINGKKVLDGWISKMPISYGANYDRLEIHGKDKTGNLVNCSYVSNVNEWKNQSIKTLITNLCLPQSIPVTVDNTAITETAKIIETYKSSEGIPVSELIIELCRDAGVFAMSIGDGKLTLTKDSSIRARDSIVIGENARTGFLVQSNENRFSDYIVKGYGISVDSKTLPDYISPFGSFSDPIIKQYCPKVLFSEGITNSSKCKDKAIMEARIRAGLSRAIIYEVHEWVQINNKPWQVNTLVRVKDSFAFIDDTMLIVSLDFVYKEDDGGDITKIMVIDKNAFSSSQQPITIKTRFDV